MAKGTGANQAPEANCVDYGVYGTAVLWPSCNAHSKEERDPPTLSPYVIVVFIAGSYTIGGYVFWEHW